MPTQVLKGSNDTRSYKYLTLGNKLQCLIASDLNATKSAASLSVGVGSASDPRERPGMAHFVEHMLFMGTKTFPLENEYSKFISQHSGYSNAFTSMEITNYYFKIDSQFFADALERFASFFHEPLFIADTIERERKAVHSEHQNNLSSEPWRNEQLSRHISNPNSLYNRFSTGDQTTLAGDTIRDEMIQFYNKTYSANLMKVCVIGPFPLAEIEAAVTTLFSRVPNHDYKPIVSPQKPFTQEYLGRLIKKRAVQSKHKLIVKHMLPLLMHEYRQNPLHYLSHLIGHEGKGSLLSALLHEDLGTQLSAYSDDNSTMGESQINIIVSLTQKGLEQYHRVIRIYSSYLKMLKKEGVQAWVFEEVRRVKAMKLANQEKERTDSFVENSASRLQKYPPQDCLVVNYLMQEYKPEVLTRVLSQISLKQAIVCLSSPDFKDLPDRQPIYNLEFSTQQLPQQFLDFEDSEAIEPTTKTLAMPDPNPYIPTSTSLHPLQEQALPLLAYQSERSKLYYCPDQQSKSAMCCFNLCLTFTESSLPTARTSNLNNLLKMLISKHLSEHSYMAECANLTVNMRLKTAKLFLEFSGFDQTLPLFAVNTITKVRDFLRAAQVQNLETTIEQARAELEKEQLAIPYRTQIDRLQKSMAEHSFELQEKLSALDITQSQVQDYLRGRLPDCGIVAIALGNLTLQTATKLIRDLEGVFADLPVCKEYMTSRGAELQPGDYLRLRTQLVPAHVNSSLLVFRQAGPFTPQNVVLSMVVVDLLGEKFMDYVRTKKAVGYAVAMIHLNTKTCCGILYDAQSCEFTAPQMLAIFAQFYDISRKAVEELDQAQFLVHKQSVRGQIDEKEFKQTRKAARYWTDICNGSFLFARKDIELATLSALTLEQFKKKALHLLFQAGAIQIQAICDKHEAQSKTEHPVKGSLELASIRHLIKRCKLFPSPFI